MNLENFDGLILDWDGVFTDGRKTRNGDSSFSEIDLMGLNLLRFGFFLQTSRMLRIAIVTGERNPTAEHVALREHFDHFIYYCRNKKNSIPILGEAWASSSTRWMFVFDDVLDFGLAQEVSLRAMVVRPQTTRTKDFAVDQKFVDIELPEVCGIRHFCENTLAQVGIFDIVVNHRINWTTEYQSYWKQRSHISTEIVDNSQTSPG